MAPKEKSFGAAASEAAASICRSFGNLLWYFSVSSSAFIVSPLVGLTVGRVTDAGEESPKGGGKLAAPLQSVKPGVPRACLTPCGHGVAIPGSPYNS